MGTCHKAFGMTTDEHILHSMPIHAFSYTLCFSIKDVAKLDDSKYDVWSQVWWSMVTIQNTWVDSALTHGLVTDSEFDQLIALSWWVASGSTKIQRWVDSTRLYLIRVDINSELTMKSAN